MITYQKELQFLEKILKRTHLQVLYLDPEGPVDKRIDIGFREFLGLDIQYREQIYSFLRDVKSNTIYRLKDAFSFCYLFFLLPDTEPSQLMLIGPYLSEELTHEQMLEYAERYGVPPKRFPLVQRHYSALPVLSDKSRLFMMIDVFAETIWNGNYTVEDINQTPDFHAVPDLSKDVPVESEDTFWQVSILEQRYAYENQMIRAVTQGQEELLETMIFPDSAMERRVSDPVQNIRNYGIILNTLLRKAAEAGGVHPLYLDRLSSAYAKKIEQIPSSDAGKKLMNEICLDYCRMVKNHATKHCSAQIQKVILYIDMNLGGDLSLNALSKIHNINASYLSTRFKKETGQTLTDFINERRVRHACHLLMSTKLQIQTISQYCGITDVNYFSRIFKKYTGKTPGEYRRER